MARPPVWKMTKKEIVKLAKWRCMHGETGLSHYQCYLRSKPEEEHRGYLDIETSNLHASFGIVLCYAIKDSQSDVIYSRAVTAQELRTCLDKKVIEQCMKDMQRFDRVCTFYGSRFDVPFLRTRALALGIEFPEFGLLYHTDMYFTARARLRLHSNRLEQVCRTLFGETSKTHIDPTRWIKALQGDKEALGYIQEHCKQDTIELERVYNTLINYTRKSDTSI